MVYAITDRSTEMEKRRRRNVVRNVVAGHDDLTEGQQWRHSQGDTGRDRLRFDPERDPRHDDDQRGRYVRVEEVIAQPTAQIEHDLDAREVAGRVLDRAVGRVIIWYVQLGKLDLRVHH